MGAADSQEIDAHNVGASNHNPLENLPDHFNETEAKIYEDTNKKRHVYHDESDEDEAHMTQKKEGFIKRVYYGEFEKSEDHHKEIIRDGKGIMLYKKGDKQRRIKYVGDFKDDEYDGYGTLESYAGAKYEGNWVKGKREGKGYERTENNSKYNGYFRNNKRHG